MNSILLRKNEQTKGSEQMEKKLITICAVILVATSSVNAATVYTDRASWEAAVAGAYLEEDFDDGVLDPGISVMSTLPGAIQPGSGVLGPDNVWWDRLICPGQGETVTAWTFAAPISAFGADWDLAGPGGPGANIQMYLNGELVGSEILGTTEGTFWGVTNGPFDTVLLTSGSECGWAWCETYEMDNMVYSLANQPPDSTNACADPVVLWPPNHRMVPVSILGVIDPDGDPVTVTITGITSDEPTASDKGSGGAKHAPDADGIGTDTASVRAECSGTGNGRVYTISFIACDGRGGECEGSVTVCVPHDQGEGNEAIDDGQNYDATGMN
jgi:hypothetical protein